MISSKRVRQQDITALIRLANELHEVSPHPIVRHQHMLRSLAALLGAQVGVSMLCRVGPPSSIEKLSLYMLVHHGWDDRGQANAANEYFQTMSPTNPIRAPIIRRSMRESPATYRREQLVNDDRWYRSAYVEQRHRAMGVDHVIYSAMPFKRSRLLAGIGVYRRTGERRRFSDRERAMLRMFHSQADWMYEVDPVDPSDTNTPQFKVMLSPRQKQTLRLLLSGEAENQIATKLMLSRQTVHEHVGAIYRALGVCGRGELLAKFLRKG